MRAFTEPLEALTAQHQECECRAVVVETAWFEWDLEGAYMIGRPSKSHLADALREHLMQRDEFEAEVLLTVEEWSDGVPCFAALVRKFEGQG